MKLNDVIGFAALGAGFYYWGAKTASWMSPQDLFTNGTWVDIALVLALLVVGFYFAVILS